MRLRLVLFCLCLLLALLPSVHASHIRAGEITAERITNNLFEFTLIIYANSFSSAHDDSATFNFGDLTSAKVRYSVQTNINAETYSRKYVVQHAYGGDGYYIVSYREEFRNAGILNISNPAATAFYLETMVSVSSLAADNNPVQLTIPPLDKGTVGELFVHNPGAYDPDGDSISYKLVIPKSSRNVEVNGYFTPYFSSSFTLDPQKGNLRWDEPVTAGLYNVAFIIEEWRKGVGGGYARVGFVTRDMQIRIIDGINNPPIVRIPEDTCVAAGTLITATITATDPDLHSIVLSAFPDTYFTAPAGAQPPPMASGTFSWQTTCADVREQPYSFVFQASDRPVRDTLSDYKTWLIRVKGPAPAGLTTTAVGNSIALNWNNYPCPGADKIEIYRRSCDSSGYLQDPCESGLTGFPGYVRIAEVPASATTFLDNNKGNGLTRGIDYCYLMVAKFPLPKGGESYASQESCSGVRLDVAVPTEVSVLSTSTTTGSIQVSWLDPIEPPFAGPFTYRILRARGINGTAYVQIATGVTSPFTDMNLNTEDSAYRYRIEILGGNQSDPASSVYLSAAGSNQAVNLTWNSQVPWNEDSVQIFRSLNGGPFTMITSLTGNPHAYSDDAGLTNCDTALYYLRVFGSYCDTRIPQMVLINLSQTATGIPQDDRAPDKPKLTVKGCDGDLSVFYNMLDWNSVSDPVCNNIRKYNIYFSEYEHTPEKRLDTTDYTITAYTHQMQFTSAGCYTVAAVNNFGKEGKHSNKVCVDDCVFYELPNLITPNNDSLNDVFRPFPVPRGVEVVDFSVYNGWGEMVYSGRDNIYLNWPGINNQNEKLSDGIYYFNAEVKYYRRQNKSDEFRRIKGWVHILNNQGSGYTD